jgi:mRNA interferase MazF
MAQRQRCGRRLLATATVAEPLRTGTVVWVRLDPTVGREQAGTRPAVIVASGGYLSAVPELAILVPVTTTDRGWPHHVRLAGPEMHLPNASFAMTEQPRTISRARITGRAGEVDSDTMIGITNWIRDFLDL